MGERSAEAILETGTGRSRLKVEFERIGEFYSHSVSKAIGSEEIGASFFSLLESRQDEALPHVACFTELHSQGEMIFLTGASGPCHWSMSVEIATARLEDRFDSSQRPPDSQFLFFDVACRHKEAVADLCSEYDLNSNFPCEEKTQEFGMLVSWNPIRVGMIENSGQVSDSKTKCLFSLSEGYTETIRFSSVDPTPQQFPATVRWSYGIKAD